MLVANLFKLLGARRAGRGRDHLLITAAGNVGYAASFWLFPASYRVYRMQKQLFNAAFRRKTLVIEEPRFAAETVIIQGFRHSGNLFVESNVVAEDQHRIPPIRHRPWIVKNAVKRSLPVVVLVRHPMEVAATTFYRTTKEVVPDHPVRLFPWAVLGAWIGYHRSIMRFRKFLLILPFELIANDYLAGVRMIEDRTRIRMQADPDYARANRYGGDRWEVQLSWLSQYQLRKAEALYGMLVADGGQADMSRTSADRAG